jgi:hypothetical protein
VVKYRKIPPAAAANQIAENARIVPAADLQKNKTIYGTYLHTKLQNIDTVEHLHIKLWSESSISGVFLLIILNILRKLGHILNQHYKISKGRARNVAAKPSGSPYMATRLTEGTDLNHVNNPV